MKMNMTRKQLAVVTLLAVCPLSSVTVDAATSKAAPAAVAPDGVVTGVVNDAEGYPLPGVKVQVKGSAIAVVTDINGHYKIKIPGSSAQLVFSYVGCKTATKSAAAGARLNVSLQDNTKVMDQVVVTAMGIQRKEKSLTYATQSIKAEDLQKVPSIDATTGLEGKISGLTVTPSAGGAGGASKILLRGNMSINGNNEPLIVVDGVPMNNGKHGQTGTSDSETMLDGVSAEGGDALSLINPDDIESMNFLKGANAAALYGSQAANGVIMITTKKGRQGKLDISLTSNVTAEMALTTPSIQNRYGAAVTNNGDGTYALKAKEGAWGDLVSNSLSGAIPVAAGSKFTPNGETENVYLTNKNNYRASDLFRTGTTFNNSISLSGGTEIVRSYVSIANSHANGIVPTNSYNRNTIALRQSYKLWDRKGKKWFNSGKVDVSLNYVEARTRNRIGGGRDQNPIYAAYTTPANVDMNYYKKNYAGYGSWYSEQQTYWSGNALSLTKITKDDALYSGPLQQWIIRDGNSNNPYWLLNMNKSTEKEMRVYGYGQANVEIWDGISFQARFSLNKYKYNTESNRYATTYGPVSMYDYGTYSLNNSTSTELYTDYLLSYNKTFKKDWSVSATVGYVGHTIKSESEGNYVANATYTNLNNLRYVDGVNQRVNLFDLNSVGLNDGKSTSTSSNWDQAALATVQLGWKDAVYIDGSYREDWYRPFRQFYYLAGTPTHYGYFGVGGTAIISSLIKNMPKWFTYLKARVSYSEVGNSLPNVLYSKWSYNLSTGGATNSTKNIKDPRPETTKSFETGLEMMFLDNCLSVDATYYNTALHNMYLTSGNNIYNTGRVRNQGLELTVGYNFKFGKDWRWKTSVNYSYNYNRIESTAYNTAGEQKQVSLKLPGQAQVPYTEGSAYGDIYATDVARFTAADEEAKADPSIIGMVKINAQKNQLITANTDNPNSLYVGNMYSPHTIGWSNSISWKNFNLSFLINGRIGGRMIDLTDAYLDKLGLSERTADARDYSDQMGWTTTNAVTGEKTYYMYAPGAPTSINGVDNKVSVKAYYQSLGGASLASTYNYSSTNFRLRELTFGYTFRDLLGPGNHLTLSFVGRNLFFIYKDAPSDPDVSLSTANSLGGIACFNFPSTRTLGFSLKVNYGNVAAKKSSASNDISFKAPEVQYVDREVEKIVEKPVVKEVVKNNPVQSTYVVTFAKNSSEIANTAELDGIASGSTVEVVAYSTPEGSKEGNFKISEKRADAVAKYLLAHGVKVLRSTAKGADTNHANRIAIVTIK